MGATEVNSVAWCDSGGYSSGMRHTEWVVLFYGRRLSRRTFDRAWQG